MKKAINSFMIIINFILLTGFSLSGQIPPAISPEKMKEWQKETEEYQKELETLSPKKQSTMSWAAFKEKFKKTYPDRSVPFRDLKAIFILITKGPLGTLSEKENQEGWQALKRTGIPIAALLALVGGWYLFKKQQPESSRVIPTLAPANTFDTMQDLWTQAVKNVSQPQGEIKNWVYHSDLILQLFDTKTWATPTFQTTFQDFRRAYGIYILTLFIHRGQAVISEITSEGPYYSREHTWHSAIILSPTLTRDEKKIRIQQLLDLGYLPLKSDLKVAEIEKDADNKSEAIKTLLLIGKEEESPLHVLPPELLTEEIIKKHLQVESLLPKDTPTVD